MLPMALFITMIAVAASTLVVGMVLFSIGQTQIGESRVQDNVTAEAGVDAAIAALEQSTGTNPPCAFSGTSSATNGATFDVTIDYYAQTPALDGLGNPIPLACPLTTTPYNAIITSTGQATAAGPAGSTSTQTMTAMVRLRVGASPDPWTNGFSAAVSSGRAVTLSTNWILTGAGGNFYVLGNFRCNRNLAVPGNLYSSGTIRLSANASTQCTVQGDMWSGSTTTNSDPSVVTGNVKVNGTINVASALLTVGGDASYLTRTGAASNLVAGTIHSGVSVGAPPLPAQPKVVYNAADWTGWSIITPAAGTFPCSTAATTPASWTSPAGQTVYRAVCNPVWNASGSNVTLTLNGDVTIFLGSANNIDVVDNLIVTSGDALPHKLRIIVPFATLTSPCAGTPTRTMIFRAQLTVNSPISALLYTSGRFDDVGTANMRGQVFACGINSTGNMTLDYQTVGTPSSASSGGSGTGPYEADILYLRDAAG
jgi:hypothetical protein